jgi:restriction system protein
MTPSWTAYQEEAAEFFRSLNLEASTNVTLQGVRTTHDIDVFVKVDVFGFEVRWLIECKHWKTPVTKLHVLALREIVSDLGADRGILLCEVGFQSGAIEAANLTNVQVTSLAALAESSRDTIYAARLRELYNRTEKCKDRYWAIPKDVRIEHGIRSDVGEPPVYSGSAVVQLSQELLSRAFRGAYPIQVHAFERHLHPELPDEIRNNEEMVVVLERLLADFETRLAVVEHARAP